MTTPSPTPTPGPVSGNIIYDLATRLGTAGLAVFVLMQVNSRMQEENRLARDAFVTEGKEMRSLFQTDSEKDRQLHRESLRTIGEQALKQNEKTTAAMDRAIEEMRRATTAMEDTVRALERGLPMRPGPESRIRPVAPNPVKPPAKPPAVSARLVRAVTTLAVYCSIPLIEPSTDPPVKLGGQPSPHADPPTPPPPPPADEPVPLDKQRFRLFWVDNYKGDVPIRWKVIPLDDKAALNLVPVKPGDSIISVIQGEDDFKEHTVPESKAGSVAVYGRADGLVLLTADGVENDRIVTLLSVKVKVGQGSKPPPVVVNPPDKPPEKPPVDKPGPLFFAIIRPDGAVSRDLEKVLANPEWDVHRRAGRSVKVYTAGEVADHYPLPNGTRLPCVLTLRISADGKSSTIAREPIDLPTSSDGIRKLNEGIK
ncbi:MAG: hypothetical protein U0798_15025 [Gemmataceae bacterium]